MTDDGRPVLEAQVGASAASDPECVERLLATWTFTAAEWDRLRDALPGQLEYRFKASASEREALKAAATRGLDELCAIASRNTDVVSRYLATRERLPVRLQLRFDGLAQSLAGVPPASHQPLFEPVLAEATSNLGLGSRCTPSPDDLPRKAPTVSPAQQHLDVDGVALRVPRTNLDPAFVSFSARPGVASAELERVVRTNLASLSECVAFSREANDTLEAFEPTGDDLVTVALSVSEWPAIEDDEKPTLRVSATITTAGWSDSACVKAVVSNWPFPLAQLEAIASLAVPVPPAVEFSYRFRPSDAAKAALRAANEKALAPICDAYRGVSPKLATPEAPAVARLADAPPLIRHLLRNQGVVMAAIRSASDASDQGWLWADSWREIELMLGVRTPCPAFAEWPTHRAR